MRRGGSGGGFTIVEMMIVVAIVAVLSTFALPAMRDLVATNRMKSLSLDIYTSLALARSEAIKRSANNVSMIATGGVWQNGWTACVDSDSSGTCDGGEPVLIAGDAVDASLTLTGPTGPARVTYNRDGRLATATASASFQIKAGVNNAGSPMRCVDVDASGRPRSRADTNQTDSDGCN